VFNTQQALGYLPRESAVVGFFFKYLFIYFFKKKKKK
jgi:hypothetical protein